MKHLSATLCVSFLLYAVTPADAGVVFTSIAHSNDGFVGAPFNRALSVPTMNNHGQVVFRGRVADGTLGIYVGDGVSRKLVADSNGPFPGIGSGPPGIGDDGTVAFLTNIPGGNSGTRMIARGNVNSPTNDLQRVVGRNDALPGLGVRASSSGDFAPAVNNQGQIAVAQGAVTGSSGVYRFDGSTTVIADPISAFGGTSLNDSGEVAFLGDAGQRIYLGDGQSLTPIVDISLRDGSFRFDMPDLNIRGEVVFYAGNGFGGGFDGIYHYDGSQVQQLFGNTADTHFEVNAFEDLFPGINDFGNVAGLGHVRNATNTFVETLFIDDPLTGKIVSAGDEILGRTVSDLDFYKGINNRNQVAFFARFTDGTEGIYRAEFVSASAVPEPTTGFTLCIFGLGGLALVRHRRNDLGRRRSGT